MLKDLLDEKFKKYNRENFVSCDPVCIPHAFNGFENKEIAGFIAASLAWGQRATIIRNAKRFLSKMGNDPYAFLMEAKDDDLEIFYDFVHRTFNGHDAQYFVQALANIYREHGSMYNLFLGAYNVHGNLKDALIRFREKFFGLPHFTRTEKHVANVKSGAAAKRLNMFLRWMVRSDRMGVDLGIWNGIPAAALYIPLDVHTAATARALGLLKRKQNDWKAVEELTQVLKGFDSTDPVKYDFALFGMGIYEKGIYT